MGRLLLCAAFVLLALAGPLARAEAESPPVPFPVKALDPPSAGDLAKLERDHVELDEDTDPHARGTARALVLFEKPLAEVLRLLTATTRQKEYRPELARLDVIESTDHSDVAEYRLRFMLTSLRYRARVAWDYANSRIWWTLDPSFDNDMKALDGLWELRALDDKRTLGRFTTRIDLGPALPEFLQDYATRKKLPESMENVRHWVDSGGSWRP